MKKSLCMIACMFGLAVQAVDVPREIWSVETGQRPTEHRLDLVRGETRDLECRFTSYARAVNVAGSTVVLHARTNGMPAETSWQVSGYPVSNGVVAVRLNVDTWLPSDVTNCSYTLEVALTNSARLLRAFGPCRITGSSAASTNSPVPVYWLTNLTAMVQSEAAMRASGDQKGSNFVNDTVSSATGDLYRVVVKVQDTNGWEVGQHKNWLTNETDQAALAALATNRTTAIYGTNQWIDGNGSVWNIIYASSTSIVCTLSIPFGKMVAPDFYDAPSQPFYVSAPHSQITDGDWTINFDNENNGTWSVSNPSYPLTWTASGSELPIVANGTDGDCIGTATFSLQVTVYPVTNRIDALANQSDLPSTNGYLSATDADARFLSSTPGWFWQGSQQVSSNAFATNYFGVAMLTNTTQVALVPYTTARHAATGTVEIVSQSYVVGLSFSVKTPHTEANFARPMIYESERITPTSFVVRAWCSPDSLDSWPHYFAILTNLTVFGYDRQEMMPLAYTNDAAGIIARADDADVDTDERALVNVATMKRYIDSRVSEIAKEAYNYTPSGARNPSASVFTIDEPIVQQGQIAYLNSGDYFCQSYEGGDWRSATLGSRWSIGPSGSDAFEINSTNRMLRIQSFSVSGGNATLYIATNWVLSTPAIEFTDSLVNPQWLECPVQNMSNRTNYWLGVCPAVSGQRFFRAVDRQGDNRIVSHYTHRFVSGITIGTNTFSSLSELKALLNALP